MIADIHLDKRLKEVFVSVVNSLIACNFHSIGILHGGGLTRIHGELLVMLCRTFIILHIIKSERSLMTPKEN
jgi:hypothetical protein